MPPGIEVQGLNSGFGALRLSSGFEALVLRLSFWVEQHFRAAKSLLSSAASAAEVRVRSASSQDNWASRVLRAGFWVEQQFIAAIELLLTCCFRR
jgi:hypothetical protein